MTSNTKPVNEVRVGAVKAAIWRNEGENGSRFNVTFSRIYKDSEGNWKSTSSFGRDDLLVVAKVADLTHSRIFLMQSEEAAHRQGGRTAGRRATAVLIEPQQRRGASPAFFFGPERTPDTSLTQYFQEPTPLPIVLRGYEDVLAGRS